MDGRSFDSLTTRLLAAPPRRRLLRVLAGAILGASAGRLGAPAFQPSALAATCRAIGKRCRRNKECCSKRCQGATCRCSREGARCTTAEFCCSGTCDFLVGGGTCAPCRGRGCSADHPCCGGLACTNGYCDGCRDRATACTNNNQCCFSNCVSGACLSALGGRCARDVDCRNCYLGGNCAGACVGDVCTV